MIHYFVLSGLPGEPGIEGPPGLPGYQVIENEAELNKHQ